MILKVICNPDELDVDYHQKVSAFENILSAQRDGNHVVYCDRKLIRHFRGSSHLSSSSLQTISELHFLSREYKTVSNEISVVVHVLFDRSHYVNNLDANGQNIIEISYDYFNSTLRVQPSTLIPENDKDFDFFKIIADGYLNRKSNYNFNLKLSKHCGYGSHTYSVYSEYKSSQKLALCIVDNDVKYPGASVGSTARQFGQNGFCIDGTVEAKMLSVREIESLLPEEVIEEALVSKGYPANSIDVLEKMKRLEQISSGEFRKYFDHKDGITLKQALQPSWSAFWKDFFVAEPTFGIKPCAQNNDCIECGSCIKLDGFGERILEKSLEVMDDSHKRKLFERLSGIILEEWEAIGEKVIAWGCAPKAGRARAS
ncbi:hypothetical protein [Agarivorans sp. DSG3-1]|uniref:hypothetical protein n=1 Tax=Agarivorans sp. DSG3-1 TaxID=3342249 RepID=UPI00398E6B42